jgi:hypothetical protein
MIKKEEFETELFFKIKNKLIMKPCEIVEYHKFTEDLEKYPKNTYVGTYREIDWSVVRRHESYWCGYIHIKYDDEFEDFDVHRGITYRNDDKFGFDCAHWGDYRNGFLYHAGDVYKTRDWVITHIEQIIDQYLEWINNNSNKQMN